MKYAYAVIGGGLAGASAALLLTPDFLRCTPMMKAMISALARGRIAGQERILKELRACR